MIAPDRVAVLVRNRRKRLPCAGPERASDTGHYARKEASAKVSSPSAARRPPFRKASFPPVSSPRKARPDLHPQPPRGGRATPRAPGPRRNGPQPDHGSQPSHKSQLPQPAQLRGDWRVIGPAACSTGDPGPRGGL